MVRRSLCRLGLRTVANTVENHYYLSRCSEFKEDNIIPRGCPTVWQKEGTEAQAIRSVGAPMSVEQVQHFQKNGFLVLHNLFTPSETLRLAEEAREVRDRTVRENPKDERIIMEPNGSAVRSVFAVHKTETVFGKLCREKRILNVAKVLLGDDVYLHQSRINFQAPFVGTGFGWHSDFETWHMEDGMPLPRCLSASVLLTDNFSYNGPLMVIPGSQEHFIGCVGETPEENAWETSLKNALYFGTPSHSSIQKMAVETGAGIRQCTGEAGSVIFFDSNLLHASSSNLTPFPRENVFMAFSAVSNAPLDHVFTAKGRPEHLACRDPQWAGVPLAPTRV
uniref:Ectoine hydroxylase n=1 Tax=Chromera velia CCMP2878 TaxID=1169474 RepID=A0A0G4G088_9ALVE|eukprot:Cvel_19573.t1-p1 / transcript=Cvel_19573.t1 / gene=Cvel_19573 / organism=Chromera_velia_CCMP2878 / gene_product=Ectoine hydroxylase, putative / transcript_product=Ectoine hydroxylase, putative / location=Cvel_scaffold1698:9023-10027(+) / protein_length=335 / sequence_SO=supercontig / SO=protein_coding / is_pseudo=false